MTQEHPITPPPELFKQWEDDILNERDNVDHVLDCVWRNGFQAGADQELEACCEWLVANDWKAVHKHLRSARRPKPPSQAEEALIALEQTVTLLMPVTGSKKIERFDTIRTALKRLRELERTVAD